MKYFTIKEMCVSGSHPSLVEIPKPGTAEYRNIIRLIETTLDPLRDKLGKPIRVTSGYRPEKLNNAVGGSKTSAHRKGLAADLQTGNAGSDNVKIMEAMLATGKDFDQIIAEYPVFDSTGAVKSAKWIHIGLREGTGRKQLLYYNGSAYKPLKKTINYTFAR